jgi:hypothetical protein
MLSPSLAQQLMAHQLLDHSEAALREALERHTETYTLIKLAPWPARRWKCQYRLMIGPTIYDASTLAEAYALALLALLQTPPLQENRSEEHLQ